MDKNNIYKWSGIVIFLVVLTALMVVNSQSELKKLTLCQSQRIRPLSDRFFTWEGILELNSRAEYQPKCL